MNNHIEPMTERISVSDRVSEILRSLIHATDRVDSIYESLSPSPPCAGEGVETPSGIENQLARCAELADALRLSIIGIDERLNGVAKPTQDMGSVCVASSVGSGYTTRPR